MIFEALGRDQEREGKIQEWKLCSCKYVCSNLQSRVEKSNSRVCCGLLQASEGFSIREIANDVKGAVFVPCVNVNVSDPILCFVAKS